MDKINRKWMALILAAGLAAGIGGCGNGGASVKEASSAPVKETMNPFNHASGGVCG